MFNWPFKDKNQLTMETMEEYHAKPLEIPSVIPRHGMISSVATGKEVIGILAVPTKKNAEKARETAIPTQSAMAL